MAMKKGDFIEVEYTGIVKEEEMVFDTTDEAKAKELEIHNKNAKYGPIVICIGEGHILKGIDKDLEGKEVGEFKIEVGPEDGFGKKNAKLLRMIPARTFAKDNVQPVPGLQVNMDGVLGIIKTVSSGRVIVDFNHPLSGRDLVYEIKVNKIVDDDNVKIKGLLLLLLNEKDVNFQFEEGKLKVKYEKTIPEEGKEKMIDKIKELIPAVKEVEFEK
ncbi:peptidylprolyl isomerase [Nanoarchaeota archaeon]